MGVVVGTIIDPFTSEILSGVEDTADASGYSVILASSKADPDREVRIVQSLEDRRVDGILIMASRVGAAYLPLLANMAIPIVLIDNQNPAAAFVHSIGIENTGASQSAVRFLIQLGHRRIAYIGGRYGYQSDAQRLNGYRQALEAASLSINENYVVHVDPGPEGGQTAMVNLLALSPPPTAVFCYNDLTALGVLSAAQSKRLKVPDDLSVIGFDDLNISAYLNPPLTTVRLPKHQLGCAAAQTILTLISGGTVENRRSLHCDLILRESTAPPKL
jgi:DNA-binding LacI/PurR family transcriptional regulator